MMMNAQKFCSNGISQACFARALRTKLITFSNEIALLEQSSSRNFRGNSFWHNFQGDIIINLGAPKKIIKLNLFLLS